MSHEIQLQGAGRMRGAVIGAAIGGMGANIVRGEYFDHLDGTGFTAAVLVALVLLVGVDVRVRRDED